MAFHCFQKPSFRGLFCIGLLGVLTLIGQPSEAQYYPRGVRFNDNFLPNLDEPDKFFIVLDGLVDFQKEKNSSGQSVFESSHFLGQILFGGIDFRGGVVIAQDNSERDVKDLTIGFGFSAKRPLFFELSGGYLTRNQQISTFDGWAIHGRVGYGMRIVHQINYRVRLRVTGQFIYKTLNTDSGTTSGTQFFPMIGLEFET